MKKLILSLTLLLMALVLLSVPAGAQHYKLRQTSTMMGMKSETTIYVKGMRKRTEGGMMISL